MGRNLPIAEPAARWIAAGGLLSGATIGVAAQRIGARRRARAALAHERRRVAADLHDLVMQDLALALAHARMLAGEHEDSAAAGVVVSAGERAIAGARGIVNDLASEPRRPAEPIVRAVEASAHAAARSTPLSFDAQGVPSSARPGRRTREALVHIAREAVTNASKHARGGAIEVSLRYTGRWHLVVHDEGEGFEPSGAAGSDGFGLTSMREHVRALGGAMQVSSAQREGTTVEVMLP